MIGRVAVSRWPESDIILGVERAAPGAYSLVHENLGRPRHYGADADDDADDVEESGCDLG